jgi:aerobic-type carbon monoxide dehydrogenase small subunit (CoxS/CutS family)
VLTLAAGCQGKRLKTIEGLAKDGVAHPAAASFIEFGGFQCGICPRADHGCQSFTDENPKPTEEEVKEWMSGNLSAAAPVIIKFSNR